MDKLFCHYFILEQSKPLSANVPYFKAENKYRTIGEIPLPPGFKNIGFENNLFGAWLQKIPLKKDRVVHLYNGNAKANQTAQFAVLNLPVGTKDLQQCADAVMRLRAEFLYSRHEEEAIVFFDNLHHRYDCPKNCSRNIFEKYLEKVFGYCGTLSLEKQLDPVIDFENILPGDVLIKGGSPGHAVIVVNVAINNKGEKQYMLAQSYMPAQEIHILL